LKIRWTTTALIQITSICDFWTERNNSTSYANKVIAETERLLAIALKNPEVYPKFASSKYSRIPMGHFSLLYSVFDEELIIHAFWDNRQSPKKLRKLLEENRNKSK